MSVEKQSAPVERQREWSRIRNLMSGADAARREISRLPGHDDKTLKNYRARAYFLPALARTIEAFSGLLFLNEPEVTGPEAAEPILADIALDGTSAERMAETVVHEVLGPGRCAILVDHPEVPAAEGAPVTVAQAEAAGVRAFARLYRSEDILGFKYGYVGGVRTLTQVRFAETHEEPGEDEFSSVQRPAVRVCELVAGVYRQRLFVKSRSGKYVLEKTIDPRRRGAALNEIPVVFFSRRDHSPEPRRPILADLADANVSHLDSSASLEWGLMWTANPTPCFKGITPVLDEADDGTVTQSMPSIRLGSSEGLMFNAEGEAWFLEFEGKGLGAVAAAMEAKRRDMANLGARILMDDPRAQVAAETARIQNAGQNSILAGVANVVSEGMTTVLGILVDWAGISEAPTMSINTEFSDYGLSAEEIKALLAAVMAGEMSSAEFFVAMKRAGLIDRSKDEALHREEIEQDGARVAANDVRGLPKPEAA